MASSSSLSSSSLTFLSSLVTKPKTQFPKPKTRITPIRCGPRDNRGPLVKGRTLSIEAIQAVQLLKRTQNLATTTETTTANKTLSRLIKSDLIAAFNELLRQNRCDLALQVFSTVRSEYKPDLTMYADLILRLCENKMWDDIDRLISEMENDGEGRIECGDSRGVVRLIKALVKAGRVESTVRIYGLLKRSGWDDYDEYLVKVLSKGLRRLGRVELGDEVERDFGGVLFEGNLGMSKV